MAIPLALENQQKKYFITNRKYIHLRQEIYYILANTCCSKGHMSLNRTMFTIYQYCNAFLTIKFCFQR